MVVPEDDGNAWSESVEAAHDSMPRVPPGRYDAKVVRGDVREYRWTKGQMSRRFVLTLEIINHPAAGTRLEFIAALPRRAGPRSKFCRAWEVANGAPAKRRDRLALGVFRHRLFGVEVGDVTEDRLGRQLARPYSIVRSLVERIA